MSKYFERQAAPSSSYKAYTKSDTVNFDGAAGSSVNAAYLSRYIYVGTAGDVVLVDKNGVTCTIPGVPAGTFLPAVAMRINSASTTAAGFVIFF